MLSSNVKTFTMLVSVYKKSSTEPEEHVRVGTVGKMLTQGNVGIWSDYSQNSIVVSPLD